ncbi:glycosyltransferase family 2 protein [Brevundimonas goettingensis]|uniref:Glycosyltransferase family 2 protein n=1 Tax=Brevundimonas goettingensis TaxID=2774190 RepID=A0A975C3G0_9CAUL|nr:glycosyltransferase family 2 protein [Brevundimonas goettingensis]QTC91170.1 glycosyltransferase family 2 protein [Brevundimonas goettingensis]
MNILILAAGGGDTTAPDAPAGYPIWLSEIDGKLLLERQVNALRLQEGSKFIFAFRGADIDAQHVDDIARQLASDAAVVEVRRRTAGAACTALLAISHINLDEELIIVSATDHIEVDYDAVVAGFRTRQADAGILTFDSLHPRYSFVTTDADGWVLEAAEKRPISRQANAGFYWYARARDFIDSVQRMILKDAHLNGVFYISPSLNEMVLRNKRIAVTAIDPQLYHPLKDQRQVLSLDYQIDERKRHAS